ncbi:MAG: hypothetical protein HYX53_01115 [Chloroflexi bacterium]|nr:hypothetical protein [Chloroflexota bacterium]
MGSRVSEEIAERGHAPGEHLFEYLRAERVNAEFERRCVGYTVPKGGCGKVETVGQTCLICDNDGVRMSGVVVLFELSVRNDPAVTTSGPLCQECLAAFANEGEADGVRIVDCYHEIVEGRCRWCGEPG